MNERIKELEKQCWDHQTNHLNAEKFAELIVLECLSKVDASHPLEERSEWGQNSFAEETIKRKIKRHFGVEE